MHEIKKYFCGRKVLITGHTGFKGSWLAFILKELGADVMGFALPPSTLPNHFDLLNLESHIRHEVGNIRNETLLVKVIQEFQPEFVFHLAAQSLVRSSYLDPVQTFSTNIIGSVNLLEAIRLCSSVRSLVYVTSDKCYENMEWCWGYRENDKLGGRDPYSASKASAEIVFSSYVQSFLADRGTLGAASARAGNVIGGGDWSTDRIIPDCIRAIESGQPIDLRNPNATRPWQHVLEPLWGYLMLSTKLYDEPKRWGGAWNFGPTTDDIRTVKEVAESMVEYMGNGVINITGLGPKVYEANLLQLNCDKARQLLGWRPRWNVDKTLEATAMWYKNIMSGKDPASVTKGQILNFLGE